jgi:hypothetical protein
MLFPNTFPTVLFQLFFFKFSFPNIASNNQYVAIMQQLGFYNLKDWQRSLPIDPSLHAFHRRICNDYKF